MENNLDNISTKEIHDKFEENLFVKNIIINKDKGRIPSIPYIATQRWLEQLGNRVEITC